jgi:hypothetical protein
MMDLKIAVVLFLAVVALGCTVQETRGEENRSLGVASPENVSAQLNNLTGQPDVSNCTIFPPDNPWNTDISNYPIHNNSDNFIKGIGQDDNFHPDFGTVWGGGPNGIPYDIVNGSQQKVSIRFTDYGDESDPGPYPVPPNASVEHGEDRHVIVVDLYECMLYELYNAYPEGNGWKASSGALYNLSSNKLRPTGWTSADAAGLPMFPGLVRYDEVESGEINHALRFTTEETQQAFILPATHYASAETDPDLPPMGLRFRLKKDFDISGFSENNQVILRALKKYGMLVADNGGNWFLSGAPDTRWDDEDLAELKEIKGSDFEVVYTGEIVDYE